MRSSHQVLEVLHCAEVIFYLVFIDGAIAVIVRGGIVVLVERRQPECGDAEILEIGQVLLNALEISAVIGHAVACGRRCPLRRCGG